MVERKYAKYFITDFHHTLTPEAIKKHEEQRKTGNYVEGVELYSLGDEVIKGAFYTSCVLLKDKKGTEAVELTPVHIHDFDEVLLFAGTVKDDPHDLGGEIELWLEDEQYIITRGCLVFVPKGIKHCPLIVRRIDSPILLFTAGNSTVYSKIT